MSLQSRLFAFFVLIILVPLGVVSILARGVIVRELETRTSDQLRTAAGSAVDAYRQRADQVAPALVSAFASEPRFLDAVVAGDQAGVQASIDSRLAQQMTPIDYVIVTNPDGGVIAQGFTEATFLPGAVAPVAEEIVGEQPSRVITRAFVPVLSADGDSEIARVFGGFYLDNQFVEGIAAATGIEATIFVDQRAIASSDDALAPASSMVEVDLREDLSFFRTTIADKDVYVTPVRMSDDLTVKEIGLVVSTASAPVLDLSRRFTLGLILFLVFTAILAVLLGQSLTRGITRPLRQLAKSADGIAAGNLAQNIEVRSKDEVGKLASAFNEMAGSLQLHVNELHDSREELKRALTRFGETLRATHDMEQLLNVIVETSMDHLNAKSGLLMLLSPDRTKLTSRVSRGVNMNGIELAVGEGLAGHVVEAGIPLRLPNGNADPSPSPHEPNFKTSLMVPIFAEERAAGVLCLYDKESASDFTEVDLATLLSLADQAGVAVENIILHDQARTLSIVDTVVGTYNRRYFHQRLDQELERHARFSRPFSLLIVDIDHFKAINDTHGHQRGDAVLIELVERVTSLIREIDVFARFGGEEFVLLLPETDVAGGRRTAERIREAVGAEVFKGSPPCKITVSIGVAGYPQHGKDQDSLVRASDVAMYQAKSAGRNRTVVYEGE